MQTILGANGTIGNQLSKALLSYTTNIRQVSRHPKKVNSGDIMQVADLLDATDTSNAVKGSDVVYLVAGLQYNLAVWKEQWPRVMRNVIDACKKHNARLVFFDNVYAYGLVEGNMTEETPFNPCSQKGEVRAEIATMLLDEVKAGNIKALIARSADFYGPNAVQSFPYITIFQRLKAGKSPQWIGKPDTVHSFTYTPDAGHAVAVLGNDDNAYGQTWHVPTSGEIITGEDFVRMACELANRPYKLQVMPRWMMKLLELIVPVLRENEEMMYQFNNDYRFDSSKIKSAYALEATDYKQGIRACLGIKTTTTSNIL